MLHYLGIDLGTKTMGLAKGYERLSFPWKTLHFSEKNWSEAIKLLLEELKNYRTDIIVIGNPVHADGRTSVMSTYTNEFVTKFKQQRPEITIILATEENSTMQAKAYLNINTKKKPQKIKQYKDQLAASIILQNYLDQKS